MCWDYIVEGIQGILSVGNNTDDATTSIRLLPAKNSSFNKTKGGRFSSEVSNKLFQGVTEDKPHLNSGDRFFK